MPKSSTGSKTGKLWVLVSFFVIFGLAHALSVTSTTNPPVLYPGTSGQLILYISAPSPATSLRLKIEENPLSIEGEESWEDLGDVYGTISYALGISVPSDIKPGTYYIPLVMTYESGGTSYEEHFELPLLVQPRTPLSVEFPNQLFEGRIRTYTLTLKSERKLHNVHISVSGAVEVPIFVGDVEGEKEVNVSILPTCPTGLYPLEVNVFSAEGNYTFLRLIPCVPTGLDVHFSLPREIQPGEHNGEIIIVNNSDVARGPLLISIRAEGAELSGKTAYTIEKIGGGESFHIPIKFYTEGEEKMSISVDIHEGNAVYTYTWTALVKTEPEIVVYVASAPITTPKGIEFSIGVANAGDGEAKNVVLVVEANSVLDGAMEFIGDLSPGDYDTARVLLSTYEENIPVKVIYRVRGEERTVRTYLHLRKPPSGIGWFPFLLVVIALGALYYWRKRR